MTCATLYKNSVAIALQNKTKKKKGLRFSITKTNGSLGKQVEYSVKIQ
jgi:hypothetical protein